MGFFGDLAMGLGLKDRDASYYERTAQTLGRTQGAGREAQYRQSRAYTEQPTRGGPAAMLGGRNGAQRGGWGYGEGDARVSALRDMLDGGGRGRAGQRFEGGLLADLANALGIRPLGYQERLAAAQQQPSQKRAATASGPMRPQARPIGIGMNNPQEIMTERMLRRPASMGYPLGTSVPTAPQGMFTSPLSIGSGSFPTVGGIYDSYVTGPDYTSKIRPSTLPVVTPTGGMPWVYNPLTPSTSNIRGTGTGGGGYGFPAAGAYTF